MESELMDLRFAHRLDHPDDAGVEVATDEVEHRMYAGPEEGEAENHKKRDKCLADTVVLRHGDLLSVCRVSGFRPAGILELGWLGVKEMQHGVDQGSQHRSGDD